MLDAALLHEVIGGHDVMDSTSIDVPVPPVVAAAQQGLTGDLAGVRVGVVREFRGDGYEDGVLASFGVSAPLPLTKRLILMPHIRASWASTDTMQTYFGVTPVQAAASMFPAFNAGSGLRDVRGGVNLIYRLNPHWFLAGDTSVTQLLGDAAKSPISISNTNVMVTTMVGYHF